MVMRGQGAQKDTEGDTGIPVCWMEASERCQCHYKGMTDLQ